MDYGSLYFCLALILVLARISAMVERIGQPAVMGELLIGILVGWAAVNGLDLFASLKHDSVFRFLSELGVVILLFEVGLESKIEEMRQLGVRVFLVAGTGVAIPFLLGYGIIAPLWAPGSAMETRLFLGAMLTATSVGITARVFKDVGRHKSEEARIVLGAAVIDDVLGLSLLAVVGALLNSSGSHVSGVAWITLKAVGFLGAALLVGRLLARRLGRWLSRINPGIGMKFILAIGFCLAFAGLADLMGLAPIVGAFAAGLILEPVHFVQFDDPDVVRDVERSIGHTHLSIRSDVLQVLETHADVHIQTLIQPLAYFLVPLFFVRTGMDVQLDRFLRSDVLLLAAAITAAAFTGKLIAGLFAGPVKKSIVGWGLVPRGEVTLIFAATGKRLGVLSDSLFSAMIVMTIISTVLVPPVLTLLLKSKRT
jgi:Kef-type K+ transport system membrane component KefB